MTSFLSFFISFLFPSSPPPILCPPPTLSMPTLRGTHMFHPVHTNSKVYSHNYAMSTAGLALDLHWTLLDLVPMPRGTIYIPSSNLSDLSSLINPFLCITHPLSIVRLQ